MNALTALLDKIPWAVLLPFISGLIEKWWKRRDDAKRAKVEKLHQEFPTEPAPVPVAPKVELDPAPLILRDEALPVNLDKVWPKREIDRVDTIVVHHTATDYNKSSFQALARYFVGPNHINASGLRTIPYHFGIDDKLGIFQFNQIEDSTPCAKGINSRAIHIALLGDFDTTASEIHDGPNEPTQKQLMELRSLISYLLMQYPGLKTVTTHRKFGKVFCPGDIVVNFLKEYVPPRSGVLVQP